MEQLKTSQNQREAVKRYEAKNKEHASYLKSRSSAKSFFNNKATLEDLNIFEQQIKNIKAEKYNSK